MISAIKGAIASDIVLTALAPIASLVSTISSVITIGPTTLSITFTRRSLAPPPNLIRIGSCSLASSRSCSLAWRIITFAEKGDGTLIAWICEIITGPVSVAVKPPRSRAIRAALLAAATTDGSSIAIGTR